MATQNKKRRLRVKRLVLVIFLFIFLIGMGGLTGLVAASLKDMPSWSQKPLELACATRIYDSNNNLITKVGNENRVPVNINQIPEVVRKAFLSAEDHEFYEHHGVSPEAILRAGWNNITHGEIVQGGSTITQQLVKQTYLSPEQTLKRKIQEAYLSIKLERTYSKKEILQMYLNRIYLGEGAYGVQAAARTYFDKDIEDINTLNEAATLAALPKGPVIYSPFQNYEKAKNRRDLILDKMVEYGHADKEKAAETKKQEIPLNKNNNNQDNYPYPYYVDYVINELIEKYGDEKVFTEGLNVYTNLDPQIQDTVQTELSNPQNYPASGENKDSIIQPQGAMVIMEPSTGKIRAMVGGREHKQKRELNRVTRPRQPGSAFKPIIAYGPAVEKLGMGPATVIDDIPEEYPEYGDYSPHNFDGKYRGLITMRTALTQSVNVAAVKTFMEVGITDAIKFAGKLGIHLKPENHGPALALGGIHDGATPLKMTAAYCAFANKGRYNSPTAISKVETQNGKVLDEYQASPIQAMDPSTAFLITDMLNSVVKEGTGTEAYINRPMAGKTGTTEENKDAWFVGYTPDYAGAVWIGHDNPTTMPGVYGGTYPAGIWKKVMTSIHKDVPVHDFEMPSDIVEVTVDSKSGLLPGPNTPEEHEITDYFEKSNVPTETDDLHQEVKICPESGKLANEHCPDPEEKVMLELPYTVPDEVEDSDIRAPEEKCDIHGPGSDSLLELPDLPDNEEENSDTNTTSEQEN